MDLFDVVEEKELDLALQLKQLVAPVVEVREQRRVGLEANVTAFWLLCAPFAELLAKKGSCLSRVLLPGWQCVSNGVPGSSMYEALEGPPLRKCPHNHDPRCAAMVLVTFHQIW